MRYLVERWSCTSPAIGRMRTVAVVGALFGLSSAIGCRTAVGTGVRVAPAAEDWCWSVFRTHQTLASVVNQFAQAIPTLGFGQPTTRQIAETTIVSVGPERLADDSIGVLYLVRVAALPMGDSTRVRFDVEFAAPKPGWREPTDTIIARSQGLRLCNVLSSVVR